jgi:hypothetical protein
LKLQPKGCCNEASDWSKLKKLGGSKNSDIGKPITQEDELEWVILRSYILKDRYFSQIEIKGRLSKVYRLQLLSKEFSKADIHTLEQTKDNISIYYNT